MTFCEIYFFNYVLKTLLKIQSVIAFFLKQGTVFIEIRSTFLTLR